MTSQAEGHLGQADQELKRASKGRIEAVLSLLDTGEQQLYVLHVRLLPQARTLRRRFREVDALRLMGFTPRPECHYFPYQCFYAGCYYRELGIAPDDATRQRFEEDLRQVAGFPSGGHRTHLGRRLARGGYRLAPEVAFSK